MSGPDAAVVVIPVMDNTTQTADSINMSMLERKTILLGSSITKSLDCKRFNKPGRSFINISQSGARLLPVKGKGPNQPWVYREMLKNYAETNCCNQVDAVIFSLGPNDIKYYKQFNGRPGDLGVFRRPIEDLIADCRRFFGNGTEILFHSVLPMRCLYNFTPVNFLGFNRLLLEICCTKGCYFIDWFDRFPPGEKLFEKLVLILSCNFWLYF